MLMRRKIQAATRSDFRVIADDSIWLCSDELLISMEFSTPPPHATFYQNIKITAWLKQQAEKGNVKGQ